MIAVDTNVLLRRLLDDDATQAEKARRLFETNESVLVTDVVLAETVWTLTGKRYGAGKGRPCCNHHGTARRTQRGIGKPASRLVRAQRLPQCIADQDSLRNEKRRSSGCI